MPGAFGTLTPAQIAAIYNHSSVLRFLHEVLDVPPPPGLLPSAESPLNPGLREVGVDLNVATVQCLYSGPPGSRQRIRKRAAGASRGQGVDVQDRP